MAEEVRLESVYTPKRVSRVRISVTPPKNERSSFLKKAKMRTRSVRQRLALSECLKKEPLLLHKSHKNLNWIISLYNELSSFLSPQVTNKCQNVVIFILITLHGLSRKLMGISKKICNTEKEELPVSHTSEICTEELYFSVE